MPKTFIKQLLIWKKELFKKRNAKEKVADPCIIELQADV